MTCRPHPALLSAIVAFHALVLPAAAQPTYELVSIDASGAPGALPSRSPSLSGRGEYVAFLSDANLVAADTVSVTDVYVRDRMAGQTTKVSVASDGTQANGASASPGISTFGRFVVFTSVATNLVSGDTNGVADVFVHDRQTGATERVSVSSLGVEADDFSESPVISEDGRYVGFVSWATNLVPGDTNNFCPARASGQRTDNCSDVFVRDRVAGTTIRISVPDTGGEANGPSSAPSMNNSGCIVAFQSLASNLVPSDTNAASDVFVHRRYRGLAPPNACLTGRTTRESVTTGGAQMAAAGTPVLGWVGRWLVFAASAPLEWPSSTFGSTVDVIRDLATGTTVRMPVPDAAAPPVKLTTFTSIYDNGRFAVASYNFPRYPGVFLVDRAIGALSWFYPPLGQCARQPTLTADGDTLALVGCQAAVPGSTADQIYVVDLDADHDGMGDAYERLFGLNPSDTTDGSMDSDGDAVSNLDEFLAGTHPHGTFVRYFAEGATGSVFDTRLDLFNPGATTATTLVRFERADGSGAAKTVPLLGTESAVLEVARDIPGLEHEEFSTVIESDAPLAATRTMDWGADRHAESGVAAPSTRWYFAEGATHSGFQLFYLLLNPGDAPATVQATWLRPPGTSSGSSTYVLAPHSRRTIWVNYEEPSLANGDVAATFDADHPIVAERVMYTLGPNGTFAAGHCAAGVPAPSTDWFFAEGATGSLFDMFLLLANPTALDATVDVGYLLPDGSTVSRNHAVHARQRATVWVDFEDARLANTAVSMHAKSNNGVPIVAERAMWWPGPTPQSWYATHASAGAQAAGTLFAAAGLEATPGTVASPTAVATYLLVGNPSGAPAQVKVVTYSRYGGPGVERHYSVPSLGRLTVRIADHVAQQVPLVGGATVESLGTTPSPIVVEVASYADVGGVSMRAGTNAPATRLR